MSAPAQASPVRALVLAAALIAGELAAGAPPQAGPAAASGEEGSDLILALDAAAAAAGDLDGDGTTEWLAALWEGGIIGTAQGGALALVSELHALDLAVRSGADGRPGFAAIALEGGGIALLVPGGAEPPEILAPEMEARAVALADVDGDALPDVIAANAGEGVLVLFGAGGGAVLTDLAALDIAAGDFLGTGEAGFALAGPGGVVSLLDGEGEILLAVDAPGALYLAATDLDGDGADEAVAGDGRGALRVVDFQDGTVQPLEPGPGDIDVLDPFVVVRPPAPALPDFLRGDANEDEEVDLSDAIAIFNDLFLGQLARAACRKALDSNDDGEVDISDGIFVLNFLFSGGRSIPLPYPDPAADPTPDALPCAP